MNTNKELECFFPPSTFVLSNTPRLQSCDKAPCGCPESLYELGDAIVAVAFAHDVPQTLDVIGPANRFLANNGSGKASKE